jgi:hypothetical protein
LTISVRSDACTTNAIAEGARIAGTDFARTGKSVSGFRFGATPRDGAFRAQDFVREELISRTGSVVSVASRVVTDVGRDAMDASYII